MRDEQAKQSQLQREVAALQGRKDELNDPAQIEVEARRRLRYVKPGETPYIVQLPEDKATDNGGQPGQQTAPDGPWYDKLWQQVSGG